MEHAQEKAKGARLERVVCAVRLKNATAGSIQRIVSTRPQLEEGFSVGGFLSDSQTSSFASHEYLHPLYENTSSLPILAVLRTSVMILHWLVCPLPASVFLLDLDLPQSLL